METRFAVYDSEFSGRFAKRLTAASRVVDESPLPRTTQELVKIRASQLNKCAMCLDIHTKDAAHAGETATRLNLVAAWRDATVFTAAERAALALTEEGTRLTETAGISDTTWAQVRQHYDDHQLGALIALIASINAYNRLNAIAALPAGDYQPGLPA